MTSPRETVLCQYNYDPLDRLSRHALPNIPERQRFYCKSRLATEIQGAMRYSIVQHEDQLLAQQLTEGDAPDTTLLATDQQRSVLQALMANDTQQSIAYSPYGHRPVENGLLSLLGFNGERPDPVTGSYLLGNGYRAFNPVLMRFNSPDSLSPFGKGGLNAYAYCEGEPVLGSDPTGRWKIPNPWKGIKNIFGRTPRKFRTNLENIPASSNTARKYSGSSSSLIDQSVEYNTQKTRLNLDIFKPKPNTSIIQEHGIATRQELMHLPATTSPPQPPVTTSPGNPPQQYRSRAELAGLELDLQQQHDAMQMRAYMAGDKNALSKTFNLSDHAKVIRERVSNMTP
jgi:RHS repeat-associated protein